MFQKTRKHLNKFIIAMLGTVHNTFPLAGGSPLPKVLVTITRSVSDANLVRSYLSIENTCNALLNV